MEVQAKADCYQVEKIYYDNLITGYLYIGYFDVDSVKQFPSEDTLTITTAEPDFGGGRNLAWSVERSFYYDESENAYCCEWKNIKLKKNARNLIAKMTIQSVASNGTVKRVDHDLSYYSKSSFVKKLSGMKCGPSKPVRFIVHITGTNYSVRRKKENDDDDDDDENVSKKRMKIDDVTFVVGDKQFSASRKIISTRCDVLASMFNSDMLERKTGRVVITDIEPAIFKLLLDYLDTGVLDCNVNIEQLLQLIVAANKYLLKNLVSICGMLLKNKLSVDDAVEFLIVSDLVKAEYFFKNDCLRYVMYQRNEVGATAAYKEMVNSRPDLVSELFLHPYMEFKA